MSKFKGNPNVMDWPQIEESEEYAKYEYLQSREGHGASPHTEANLSSLRERKGESGVCWIGNKEHNIEKGNTIFSFPSWFAGDGKGVRKSDEQREYDHNESGSKE